MPPCALLPLGKLFPSNEGEQRSEQLSIGPGVLGRHPVFRLDNVSRVDLEELKDVVTQLSRTFVPNIKF